MIDSESITAAETASGTVDTKGFEFASIDITLGTVAATSNNPTTFELQESDDTEWTNFATISGFVGDSDFDIPAGHSTVTQLMKFNVNLLGRKRYIRLDIASLATQLCTTVCNLHRASETPINATKAGVALLVEG
jgi:hypothetical protein